MKVTTLLASGFVGVAALAAYVVDQIGEQKPQERARAHAASLTLAPPLMRGSSTPESKRAPGAAGAVEPDDAAHDPNSGLPRVTVGTELKSSPFVMPRKEKRLLYAMAEIFPLEQAEKLYALMLSIEPAVYEGHPFLPPSESNPEPAEVRRRIVALIGLDGFATLKEAARKDAIPPGIDTSTLAWHYLTRPIGGWWPYVKDDP